MNIRSNKVLLFIDDEPQPLVEASSPVHFELDTRKLVDGEHTLIIISKSISGKEGIRKVKFTVRNGPAIDIEGLVDNSIQDGIIPLMVNSYDKGDQKQFIIEGSETPQSIPSWLWVLVIVIFAWGLFYLITNISM
ncbi:MAG: cytochrome C [Bacteroidetes bacterium]|nr:cytochrome C [Bacteroidota bacterium]